MSRTDIDHAIDRYLEGAMGAPERASFLALLERDPGAARALAAERAIRSALAADRASLPIDRTAGRSQLLSSLAALPSSPGYSPTTSIGSGSSLAATVIGSVIVVAITIVAMLTGSPSTRGDNPAVFTGSRASVPAAPHAPVPTRVEANSLSQYPLVDGRDAESAVSNRSVAPTRLKANASARAATATETSNETTTSIGPTQTSLHENAASSSIASATPSSDRPTMDTPAVVELPVIVSDSLDLDIRMGK